MGTCRYGQGGTCPPPSPLEIPKVFLCISSYSKTLSRRIIHAFFSQPAFGFWELCPQTPTIHGHRWEFRFQTRNLSTPGKKSCGRSPMVAIRRIVGTEQQAVVMHDSTV